MQLLKLKDEIEQDKSLPLRSSARLVFGEGNPQAKIYFLGEAPGFWEDKLGRPFVGAAGKLLDRLLESIDLGRENVYISNIIRFRPPHNRDPRPAEIAAFQPYVDREIKIINPNLIVTLGRFSMGKFLQGVVISRVHGRECRIRFLGRDFILIPMYHPAAALRNPQIMHQIKEDFKRIQQVLSKKVGQLHLDVWIN